MVESRVEWKPLWIATQKRPTSTNSLNAVRPCSKARLILIGQKAGDAFFAAAQLSMDLDYGLFKAGQSYQAAADCYGKLPSNPQVESLPFLIALTHFLEDIRSCLSEAVNILLKEGKFTNAGKVSEKIAEMAEAAGNITDAMIAYEKAADYHEADTHGKRFVGHASAPDFIAR